MLKSLLLLIVLTSAAIGGEVRQYKVHYSNHGSGHDIIVSAETSSDARYTVEAMTDATVTSVTQIH